MRNRLLRHTKNNERRADGSCPSSHIARVDDDAHGDVVLSTSSAQKGRRRSARRSGDAFSRSKCRTKRKQSARPFRSKLPHVLVQASRQKCRNTNAVVDPVVETWLVGWRGKLVNGVAIRIGTPSHAMKPLAWFLERISLWEAQHVVTVECHDRDVARPSIRLKPMPNMFVWHRRQKDLGR